MSELEEKSVEEAGYENYLDILNAQRRQKDDEKFSRERKYIRRQAVFFSVIFLLVLYVCLPVSRISAIQINGTHHLSEDYVLSLSGLSTKHLFYTALPHSIEKKIEADPMVEDCTAERTDNNGIVITVEEKKAVGYIYDDDASKGKVLFSDGTEADLKSEYLNIIASIPYISGFDSDQLKELAEAMDDVKDEVIAEISEIDRYALSYDANSVRIHMRNGGYYLSSMDAVNKINYYNEIYVRMSDHSYCIFGSSTADAAYSSVCPWNGEAEEYWTDSEGNYILNSSGEKAVKHYYTDASGNPAVDASGNKIPIPINESGDEVVDADFLQHYADGYYETGTLVMPSDTSSDTSSDSETSSDASASE